MILLSNVNEGKKLARKLGIPFFGIDKNNYPDGETVLKYTKLLPKGKRLIYFKFTRDDSLDAQLVHLMAILNDQYKKGEINLILPYLPYCRSYPSVNNEISVLEYLLNFFSGTVRKLYLVYPHHMDKRFFSHSLKLTKVYFVDINEELVDYFKEFPSNYILVSPDKGGATFVKELAGVANCRYIILSKRRISSSSVRFTHNKQIDKIIKSNKSKTFLVVDDVISTGKTMRDAIDYCRTLGVKNVYGVVIHNLC